MNDITTQTIPFGKYRGHTIAEIMGSDPGYLEWLQAQEWFAKKYRPIYNVMVNAAPASDMSPEHNRLQVRFLDDAFCRDIARTVLGSSAAEKILKSSKNRLFNISEEVAKNRSTLLRNLKNRKNRKAFCPERNDLVHTRRLQLALRSFKMDDLQLFCLIKNRRMEEVCDVRFSAVLSPRVPKALQHLIEDKREFFVECKPSLGDDYPAVLRQMKGQATRIWRSYDYTEAEHILLYEDFTATSVAEEQVRTIFRESRIDPIRLRDLVQGPPSKGDSLLELTASTQIR